MNNKKSEGVKQILLSSLQQMKSTQTIVFCGLMAAMGAVLKLTTSISIGNYLRLGFDWIPSRIVDFMFGPAVGAFFAMVMDVVKHFLKPMGAFDVRFTFAVMLEGLIYGFFLYKKPVKFWRVFASRLLATIVINIIINTYLLSTIMGKGYLAILPPRLLKNMIALPIEAVIMFFVLTSVSKLLVKLKK